MVSPSSAGAWVAPLPVTAGILATSASASRCAAFGIAAGGLDQARGHALLVVEQRLQQMRRRDPLMILAHRDRLRRLEESPGAVGEFLEIHLDPLSVRPIWCCTDGNTSPDGSACVQAAFGDGFGGGGTIRSRAGTVCGCGGGTVFGD